MKPGGIVKSLSVQEITDEQLEKINDCTRRKMQPEELYVFSLILCDNDIDRDNERFTTKSLEQLAALFIGKTGIFDHSAQAKNQSARIFDTILETDKNKVCATGEPYCCLKAWAYMVRCDKNLDLILEIDAGIKKEVSVGCAVSNTTCSICGQDIKDYPCVHEKGQSYNGITCCHELTGPTDAYEWSFVAVPAQKNAGVTKGRGFNHAQTADGGGDGIINKIMNSQAGIELSGEETLLLKQRLASSDEALKAYGGYLDDLRKEMIRLSSLAQPDMPADVLEKLARSLNESQLKAYCESCRKSAEKNIPSPQLVPAKKQGKAQGNNWFKI